MIYGVLISNGYIYLIVRDAWGAIYQEYTKPFAIENCIQDGLFVMGFQRRDVLLENIRTIVPEEDVYSNKRTTLSPVALTLDVDGDLVLYEWVYTTNPFSKDAPENKVTGVRIGSIDRFNHAWFLSNELSETTKMAVDVIPDNLSPIDELTTFWKMVLASNLVIENPYLYTLKIEDVINHLKGNRDSRMAELIEDLKEVSENFECNIDTGEMSSSATELRYERTVLTQPEYSHVVRQNYKDLPEWSYNNVMLT